VVSLINSIFSNIYNLVIGKYFLASDLGFYSRANSLIHYPVLLLNSVMSQVTFPVYSKIFDDKELLKKAVSSSLIKLMFVVFPVMIGLLAVATPLVKILLTEKWLPIVPYMQLLCFVGILKPIQVINLNALNAQGYSNLFLNLEIYNKVLIVIMILITIPFGITAMIYGQIIIGIISYYLNSYYTGKFLNYSFFTQIKDMVPSFLISLIMGGCVFLINYISFSSQLSLLSIQILSGIVIYSTLSYVFKIPTFFELIDLAKSVKNRTKT
jgi:O-antigen/teichoic acid export membrane protein